MVSFIAPQQVYVAIRGSRFPLAHSTKASNSAENECKS